MLPVREDSILCIGGVGTGVSYLRRLGGGATVPLHL